MLMAVIMHPFQSFKFLNVTNYVHCSLTLSFFPFEINTICHRIKANSIIAGSIIAKILFVTDHS